MFSWATFLLGGPCPAPPARPEEAVLLRPPGFGVHQALEGTHYRGSPWWGWRAKCPGFSSEWRLAVLSVVYSCTRVPLAEHRPSFMCAVFQGHTPTCATLSGGADTSAWVNWGQTHGGWGKQGPGARREGDSLSCPRAQSPAPSSWLPAASIRSLPRPLFSSVCPSSE